jgi:hypothetical protein
MASKIASDMNGAPRYGERARNQTAQSRGDQAAYAQAFAEFTRGRGEWKTGRNGNGTATGAETGTNTGTTGTGAGTGGGDKGEKQGHLWSASLTSVSFPSRVFYVPNTHNPPRHVTRTKN